MLVFYALSYERIMRHLFLWVIIATKGNKKTLAKTYQS